MRSWVAHHRSEASDILQAKHPMAFLLLCQIARRARYRPCPIQGLRIGEALIGDYKTAGIPTPRIYRTAKSRLEKCGYATFRTTNKGTVATLVDSEIFTLTTSKGDKHGDHQAANDWQVTYNGTEDTRNGDTSDAVTNSAPAGKGVPPFPSDVGNNIRITLDEAKALALEIRASEKSRDLLEIFSKDEVEGWATDWHIKAEESGWTISGKPMRTARLPLEGYLRKAANRNFKRFKELSGGIENDDDDEVPF